MFVFRFFGLTFLKEFDINEIEFHQKFRFADFFMNCLWILINVAIFVFLIISPSTQIFTRNYSKMSEMIEIANYILALATMLIILLHVLTVREKNLVWFKKLRQTDRLLRDKFGVRINHAAIGQWRCWKVLIIVALAGICSAINIYYSTIDEHEFIPFLFVHNYCLKTIINLRYIQLLSRIDFIKHHILAIHDAILKVGAQTIEWKIVLVLDVRNRKHPNLAKKIDDADDILIFKRFYSTIFESMKLLEKCFGWSLLAMISFTFIDLTSNMYWLLIAMLKLDERMQLVDCAVEIIPSVVVISCLIYSSFDVSRKAREVINSIAELYSNTTSCFNRMIKEFLMQSLHLRIESAANDFFIVDFQLLTAVSGMDLYSNWLGKKIRGFKDFFCL